MIRLILYLRCVLFHDVYDVYERADTYGGKYGLVVGFRRKTNCATCDGSH